MALNGLLELVRDPYQQKARVFPGLLTALPILVPLLWILGPKNPILTALLGLVTSCGAIYGLASVARGLGKRLEGRLVAKWGGLPTTIILRHRDRHLDDYSKARYRSVIEAKLGVKLPTVDEENAEPDVADQMYDGVTRHVRELTRGKEHALLLKENIAYGFHRNMLAMKPLGVITSLVGMLFGVMISGMVQLSPFQIHADKVASPGAAGGITLVVSIVVFASWMYFTEDHVKRIAYTYAERLFESLTVIKQQRRGKATTSAV
ncbi:hypothetical protein FOB72_13670 [Cupriavidus pauculus]|uniref:Uncharacterized protein n=1 Tax=Cupriavidus pauculus TaxID=82633 RepID=A0A5P2H663_9BURK|nr:hypothetical protein [Cupriavidus pauculus]QET02993.1 hypothetical protein FOB72_13670 [Cupriavidus pauculus]